MANAIDLRNEFFSKKEIDYSTLENNIFNKETMIEYAKFLVSKGNPFTYAVLCADDYQNINTSYGSSALISLMNTIEKTIIESVGQKALIGSLSQDKLILIGENIADYNEVWMLFHNINISFEKAKIPNLDIKISLTSGIARYPLDGKTFEEVEANNAKALYRGKEKGKACFIIYLAAKHAGIVVKKEAVTTIDVTDIIGNAFEAVEYIDDIKKAANDIIKYVSNRLSFDHISIQLDDNIVAEYINPMCKQKTFTLIEIEHIVDLYDRNGLFYFNTKKALLQALRQNLYDRFNYQNVTSSLMVDINYQTNHYGMLRVDVVGNSHSWTIEDRTLFVTIGRLLGYSIYAKNK